MNQWYQIQMLRLNEWSNVGSDIHNSVEAVADYNELIKAYPDTKYRLIKISILRPLYDA